MINTKNSNFNEICNCIYDTKLTVTESLLRLTVSCLLLNGSRRISQKTWMK